MPESLSYHKDERMWFQNPRKPGRASFLLLQEVNDMETLFDKASPIRVRLPSSSWDRTDFTLVTHDSYPSVRIAKIANGKPRKEKTFSLAWFTKFSMQDSEHICSGGDVWKLILLYPREFKGDPELEVAFAKLPRQAIYVSGMQDHVLSGFEHIKFEEGEFFRPCYVHGARPDGTAYAHAYQAILWLRSRLYTDKHLKETKGDMPLYSEKYV